MSDHEFEKQVQQKLGELKLRPSDAVWMEVEKSIRDKKRRRRFLWLWSAALLVSLTTSGVVLYHYINRSERTVAIANTTPASTTTSTSSSNHGTTTVSPNSTNTQASPIQPNEETAPADVTAPAEATISTNSSKQPGTIPPAAPVSTLATTGSNEKTAVDVTTKNIAKATIKNNNNRTVNPNKKKKGAPVTKEHSYTEPTDEPGVTAVEQTQQPNTLNAATPALAAHELDAIITAKAASEPFSNMPLNALMPDSAASANAVAAMPIQRKTPSLWHWGVKADAGYSRISVSKLFQLKGLLGTDKSYAEDLAARSYNSPAASNGQLLNVQASTTPVKVASAIQPDFSASVGVFIQRTLSPRLKVSVGIEYSYMSVNTSVGKSFDSSIAVNIGTNSLKVVNKFYESPGYIDTVRGTYASFQGQGTGRVYYSQKQRYRFHYIEMPVLLNWQINEGKRLPPIVFEGGVSIGRLFAADALHYEGVKGVYYEDNSLFNKTQFNFVTGLSVGLLQKSKHPIWIGPDLRYSLNGLVKKEVSKGQYMWSTGISFKMLLGRL